MGKKREKTACRTAKKAASGRRRVRLFPEACLKHHSRSGIPYSRPDDGRLLFLVVFFLLLGLILEEIVVEIVLEVILEILKIIRGEETVYAVSNRRHRGYNADDSQDPENE